VPELNTNETEEDLDQEVPFETLLVDVDEEGIAQVTVNRPEVLNALNKTVVDELGEVFELLASMDDVRAIVLCGGGERAFVAGADIPMMQDMNALEARDFSRFGQATLEMIEACPKPVIAMIQGFALGGGLELALACHLRVASERAKFGLPETTLGLIPGFGGTQRLLWLAGAGVAREWVMTGDAFDAAEAHRVGVVTRVVPHDKLEEETWALVRKIISRGPVAVNLGLETIRRGMDVGQSEGQAAEADAFALAFTTEDHSEGIQAFLDKRKPDFQGT